MPLVKTLARKRFFMLDFNSFPLYETHTKGNIKRALKDTPERKRRRGNGEKEWYPRDHRRNGASIGCGFGTTSLQTEWRVTLTTYLPPQKPLFSKSGRVWGMYSIWNGSSLTIILNIILTTIKCKGNRRIKCGR